MNVLKNVAAEVKAELNEGELGQVTGGMTGEEAEKKP